MPFRVLSWNIETFGERKLKGIENFVARVIQHYDADLVFILEGTVYAQGDVANGIARQLEEMTKQEWVPFGSEVTGKSFNLPPLLAATDFPRVCDFSAYKPTLLTCYTEPTPGSFVLKPETQINPDDRREVLEALATAAIQRRDLETYIGLFRRDPALWKSNKVSVALGSWVALSMSTGDLVSTNAQGGEIGYADQGSEFNGRRPYRTNLYFASPSNPALNEKSFPVVCFHSPFGKSEGPRVKANVGLLNLATLTPDGGLIRLCEQPTAMICGDFNVSYDWTANFDGLTLPVSDLSNANTRNYGSFYAADMRMTIAELSSLKKVTSSLEPATESKEFRASAYDNVIVKSDGSMITAPVGTVIDLVQDVHSASWNIGYLAGTPGVPKAARLFDAFKYVRRQVSDHLPVLCTLTVPGRQ